jgi:hypothetical protein
MRFVKVPSAGRNLLASSLFAVCLLSLAADIPSASSAASKDTRSSAAPDGVCCPVNGTGYMVTGADGIKIPLGTLSPLIEGDSLVVQTGTITFVDFRTGQNAIYGEGTRIRIQHADSAKRPSWWKRLEDHIVRGLSEPELDRIGGSVRGVEPMFWPDSARFAPGIPIVFEWRGARPAPAVLRIVSATDTTEYDLPPGTAVHGAFAWKPARPVPAGTVAWTLLDGDRERLGSGMFFVLTAAEAEAERARYRSAADELGGDAPREISAAILAESDHVYLW